MSWLFEGSCFVIKDLRKVFDKIVSSGFPYNWRGKGGGVSPHHFGPKVIEYVVYHQTYGSISPGEEGPKRTATFLTADPKFQCKECGHKWTGSPKYPSTKCPKCVGQGKNLGYGRGFPKMSYHVFAPFRPQLNENNKPILYYCVDFNERTWHSGKANKHGIAVGFQGRFDHPTLKYFRPTKGTDGQPSEVQKSIALPLWHEWIYPLLQKTQPKLMGHWEWGKAACPGGWLQSSILLTRGEKPLKGYEDLSATPPEPVWTSSELFDTHEERQAALVLLGYDLGPYGPHKNGVDGDWGEASRTALHAFEEELGLPPGDGDDGNWDEATEIAMTRVFKDNDLGADHLKAIMKGEWPLPERPALVLAGAPEIVDTPAAPPSEIPAVLEVEAVDAATVEVKTAPVEQVVDPEDPPPDPPKRRKPRKRGSSKIKAKKKQS
jgi:hypothetical protein